MRTVILLAGPSGSGKSRLARTTGTPQLRLDDFYHPHTHPGLPIGATGLVDWDDPRTWDAAAAVEALRELLASGSATVPEYSIAESRAVGERRVELGDSPVLIAEGIFAPTLLAHCREAGVPVTPVWLERSRHATFLRRLRRDLKAHRKPPLVLLERGSRLWRQEPARRREALELGFQPLGMAQAIRMVEDLRARA